LQYFHNIVKASKIIVISKSLYMGSIGPVMLDVKSTRLTEEDREILKNPLVGGLIIFGRNIENAEQVLSLTNEVRAINPNIIIAVDQEGGRVQRLVNDFSKLPALQSIGQVSELENKSSNAFASDLGELMALEVQSVGCDISFAPVLDLGFEKSRVIGSRAFSVKPDQVVESGRAYIKGMKNAGMSATGKHFPGHGSVEADSHHEIPVDSRNEEDIRALDLVPFKALASELGAMMPAHIIYEKVDENPAGFSSKWLKQILRKDCGFEGVIFSDDLSMKGAEAAGSFAQRAAAALDAGCDMVLVCNDRDAAKEVLVALKDFEISSESSKRLSRLKMGNEPVGLERIKSTERWKTLSNSLEAFNQIMKNGQED